MAVRSKLPRAGTTIFTVMSRRAAELGALNLGQGFPDYDIDPRLAEHVADAMRAGHNQYAPMPGLPALRQAIAADLERRYGAAVDVERELTVTLGATEALFSSIQACCGPGDEVLMFDPAYDSYEPAVELAGARAVRLTLVPPAFRIDWDAVRAAVTARTRLIIVNSPHNPSCRCLDADDLAALEALALRHDLTVLADEVYEHVVFDGGTHHSVLARPALRDRAIAVYSLGKRLHATGLRVGYAVAPAALTTELRKVHQFNTFTIATPLQAGIASYLLEQPDIGATLAPFFQAKRDRLIARLAGSPLRLPPSQGTYFQLLDYGESSRAGDVEFAEQLLTAAGVASIPLSPFYRTPPPMTLLRLCIAKCDETLDAAADRLLQFVARRPPGRDARRSA